VRPAFDNIEFDGENVRVETSPIRFARVVGRGWTGERFGSFTGQLFTSTSLKVSPDSGYVYMEIEDDAGKRAWTNCLVCGEVESHMIIIGMADLHGDTSLINRVFEMAGRRMLRCSWATSRISVIPPMRNPSSTPSGWEHARSLPLPETVTITMLRITWTRRV